MKAQRAAILTLLALALAAGCRDRAPADQMGQGSTTPQYERVAEEDRSPLDEAATPVRIGELGANFAACNSRGRPRERTAGGPVPVRSAPFEQSPQIDRLDPASEFFICSRSHDQRWFGIVYDEGGSAGERCGVSRPVASRRDYRGPCAAGWVSSAQIRLVSGVPRTEAGEAERPSD